MGLGVGASRSREGEDVTIAGRPTEKERWSYSAIRPWTAEMSNYMQFILPGSLFPSPKEIIYI